MDVLETQPRLETGRRRVALLGDDPSIGFVYRRSEQGVGENVDISRSVDSGLAHKGEGLAESFDHRGDQEIAAEKRTLNEFGEIASGGTVDHHLLPDLPPPVGSGPQCPDFNEPCTTVSLALAA